MTWLRTIEAILMPLRPSQTLLRRRAQWRRSQARHRSRIERKPQFRRDYTAHVIRGQDGRFLSGAAGAAGRRMDGNSR